MDNDSEPRHFGEIGTKLLIDNDQIRVFELLLKPGESSDLHHHQRDYVMVQIEGDRIAAEFEPDSEGTFAGATHLEGEVVPGIAIYAAAGGKERAVNVGQERFREIIVELKATRRPGVLPVHHVALVVRDVDAALPFYTDTLGFELLPRPDFGLPGAWLSTGNGMQIHLTEDPAHEPQAGSHVAFETNDIGVEVERLRAAGVDVGDPFELEGTAQAFFLDPSGNQFELNQPPR